MGLGNVLLVVAGVTVSAANGLEFNAVRAHLSETKTKVTGELLAATEKLNDVMKSMLDEVRGTLSSQNYSAPSEERWANQSLLYDFLAEQGPVVYEDVLDKYFSSSSDLYEYIEGRCSPWYDTFDEKKVYNWTFYNEVDTVSDELYDMVDAANDELYVLADERFEALYEIMEEQDRKLDLLDEESHDDDEDDDAHDDNHNSTQPPVTQPPVTQPPTNVTAPPTNVTEPPANVTEAPTVGTEPPMVMAPPFDREQAMQEAKLHRAEVEQRREQKKAEAFAELKAGLAEQSSSGPSGAVVAVSSIAAVCVVVGLVAVIRAKRQRTSSSTAIESQI
jgi:hypothetical protein